MAENKVFSAAVIQVCHDRKSPVSGHDAKLEWAQEIRIQHRPPGDLSVGILPDELTVAGKVCPQGHVAVEDYGNNITASIQVSSPPKKRFSVIGHGLKG